MRKTCAWLLIFVLAILFSYPSGIGAAMAMQVTQGGSADGMVRVWLSSIRNKPTYTLTVNGAYTFGGQTLASGSKVVVEFLGGTVYVTANGTRTAMGSGVTLGRQSGGVRIAEALSPGNSYPGDMRFCYAGGTPYVICTLYIEDYLYGVLPYEMDNSFPLEALKAQAVAARTYAAFSKKSSGVYDVTDTVNHQVFRGVDTSKSRCVQAVDATRGEVLKYGGAYIEASFGASNGGQTETRYNAWGSSRVAYQQVKDDPYDLANRASVAKSFLIPFGGGGVAGTMIQSALAQRLGGSASSYTINEITNITMHSPKYAAPSRVYTKMGVSVRYNGGATATVDIAVFPTVKSTLGLKINGTDNELVSVTRESGGFRVTSRRYGHGIGLSQRGAQQMANSSMGYRDILGFYYESAALTQVGFTSNWSGGSMIPEPEVTPPPVITEETPGVISLANAGDYLNLRQGPGTDTAVIGLLPNGATVTITGTTGGWYAVRYGSQTGYVASQYISVQQEGGTSPETPPAETPQAEANATVTLRSGMLNLRLGEGIHTPVIGLIPNGARLTVLEQGDVWCAVRYGSLSGYVMREFLIIDGNVPAPPASEGTAPPTGTSGTASVSLRNTREILNLRTGPSINTRAIAQLRHGTMLEILERDTLWSKVAYGGMEGYVMNAFLSFQGTGTTPGPTQAPVLPEGAARYATVSVQRGTLNLRMQPTLASRVIANLPNRAQLIVTNMNDVWCAVQYGYMEGFVMRKYLLLDAPGTAATPEPTTSPAAPQGGVRVGIVNVQSGVLNLRSRPLLGSQVLAGIPNRTALTITNMNDLWCAVQYRGMEGFVMRSYLLIDGAPTAMAAEAPAATAEAAASTKVGVVSAQEGSLSLRVMPYTGAAVMAEIPNQAQVEVINANELWCDVRYEGQDGFVLRSGLLIDGEQPDSAETAGAAPEAASGAPAAEEEERDDGLDRIAMAVWVVTDNGGSVNIRYAQSLDSEAVGTVPHGAQVTLLNRAEAWSLIDYEGTVGFVVNQFLSDTMPSPEKTPEPAPEAETTPEPEPEAETPTPSPSPEVVMAPASGAVWIISPGGGVNLRQTPSLEAEVLASLAHGTELAMLGMSEEWVWVRFHTTEGYVAAQYIAEEAPEAATQETPKKEPEEQGNEPEPPRMDSAGTAINHGRVDRPDASARLYREADLDAESVGTLADRTEIEVLRYAGHQAKWVYVRSGDVAGYALREAFALANEVTFVTLQNGGAVNVRAAASPEAEVVGSAADGTAVTVLGEEDGWVQVRLAGGTTGYILADYLAYDNG